MNLVAVLANNLQLDVLGIFTHGVFGSLNAVLESSQDGDLLGSGVRSRVLTLTLDKSRPDNLEISCFLGFLMELEASTRSTRSSSLAHRTRNSAVLGQFY